MPDVSIRRVSDLIRDIDDGTLILQPQFQRRLVWTNVVKDHFLETVQLGLPFPEIFIATGEIDTKTMKRKNLLVDGQQRVSTLREYVQSSSDLVLRTVTPYAGLDETAKGTFLDYKVAVRDLGTVTESEVKAIFERINSTDYALKAVERLNAQFSGEYKNFCDRLSRSKFFEDNNIFSLADVRRMRDLDFCIIMTTTLLSTYYNRDALNKEYLKRYNDTFDKGPELEKDIYETLSFIENCGFEKKCRIWKKTDLFTAIVEVHAIRKKHQDLDSQKVGVALTDFYSKVDRMFKMEGSDEERAKESQEVFRYLKAATKATNDKYARVDRADVVRTILESTVAEPPSRPRKRKSK